MSNRPKPTGMKILEGNRGHRTLTPDEVAPESGRPEMPKGMSATAKREWGIITRMLLNLGVLTKVDGKALMGYCEAYAQVEMAKRDLDEHGQTFAIPMCDKESGMPIIDPETKKPYIKRIERNPAVGNYIEFSKLMKSFLIEFGLTPASRPKLKLSAKPAEDEFDKLMNRPIVGFKPEAAATSPAYVNEKPEEKSQ